MKWTARMNKALNQASEALEDIELSDLLRTAKEFLASLGKAMERHGEEQKDEKSSDGD